MLDGDYGAAKGLGCRMGPAASQQQDRDGRGLCWQHQRCQHLVRLRAGSGPGAVIRDARDWETHGKNRGRGGGRGQSDWGWGWGPGSKATWSPAPAFPDPPHVRHPGGLSRSLSNNLSGVPPASGDDRNPRGGREAAAAPQPPRIQPLSHPAASPGPKPGQSPVGWCGEPPGRAAAGTLNLTAQP